MTSRAAVLVLLLTSLDANGQTVSLDNDASCDIADLPAATLLIPYFEVDIASPAGTGETTIFTVTNTSHLPQIVRVTLWTDLAYPVLSFNIYLTGYDVQSINLHDLFVRGEIAPPDGTGSDVSPVGRLSGSSRTREWDNALVIEESCTGLPVVLSRPFLIRMQRAFTMGEVSAAGPSYPACSRVGKIHSNAVGYATLDVVGYCGTSTPADPGYFTDEIRFDNVLLGDYAQVNGAEDYAQGETMVHIRAIPEGGHPRDRMENPDYRTPLPDTFYGRYLHPMRKGLDARQPLPGVYAARWITGGAAQFETHFKIWREGLPLGTNCSAYRGNDLRFVEVVRFDEEENPTTAVPECFAICIEPELLLPSAGVRDTADPSTFPPNPNGDVAGWMYMNLAHPEGRTAGQGWIAVSMRAEGRYSIDFSAQALGNGCSNPIGASDAYDARIGPLPNKRR